MFPLPRFTVGERFVGEFDCLDFFEQQSLVPVLPHPVIRDSIIVIVVIAGVTDPVLVIVFLARVG